mmetsp:Transcript_27174/g.32971  ORF Transcript_27174/g.32971 Transcript_27174/m.32971 type:complete len:677 (-) Transcript_27174:332-2362(-)|eukprot:CAMPEP_0197844104 /NCGR_PEP_ID=MMETSP1438-20131217/1081_1 /TAXON_ID=1461541 /ORGANISM="Pterosperma sp., Strain CCMP1384" /LENGTH=676 /DNA_ID=CAMNT_0043454703 /DNA_START=183 /DNA_END=2213 /DNA_ORIENTATION=-
MAAPPPQVAATPPPAAPAAPGTAPPAAPAVTPAQSASLYVGDLERDVTEAQLYDMFSQVGPVASIRVCRDAVTRRSLGYAYVNYNSALDEHAAERALETLNYQQINGKPIRIMWSHRDPAQRKSGVGNIFIKNLEETIDNKALHDTFYAFGTILSCKVATDHTTSKSKGYGFVHFETEEAAAKASETVNGMLLNGKKVYVGPFLKKGERPQEEKALRFTNVYVKNFADDTTEEALKTKFSEFGNITNVVIMRDQEGKPKGYGFVNFEDAEEAAKAVDTMNNSEFNGKTVFCGRAQKKAEREAMLRSQYEARRMERIEKYQNVNLYVKNLDDSVDDDKLREEFSAYGNITSAKVITVVKEDKTISKGFGFVCFTTPEEATKAVTEMNSKMIGGKPIYVALAQRKEVRRAQLEQQYAQRMLMPRPSAPGILPGAPPSGMYPPGTPVFYAQPGGVPAGAPRPGMVYQPMVARGYRGPVPQPRPGYQPLPPNYVVPPAQPGRQGRQRGQRAQGQPGQSPPQNQNKGGQAAMAPMTRQPRSPKYPPNGMQAQPARSGAPPAQPPPPAMVPPSQPVAVAPGVVPGVVPAQEQLTTATLAAAAPEQQKQMLGERLFPLVQRLQPELAGKITGMLLEMDNTELLLLLESPESLLAKVEEAMAVLRQHGVVLPEPAQRLPEAEEL